MTSIAYFVSPHGFGHAARASAVMAALQMLDPHLHFEVFTKVPCQFFDTSLPAAFGYHELLTDIGLAQKDSLTEDLPETIHRLNTFMPFKDDDVQTLATQIRQLNCQLVVCDIAPLGLAVAHAANVPSMLIENFTWDWIYEGYVQQEPRFRPIITYLQEMLALATYHVQTEPFCLSRAADLVCHPVSRSPRLPLEQVRQKLNIPDTARMVLLSMGGVNWEYTFLERLQDIANVHFVVPGVGQQLQRQGNVILLSAHSDFYHPDLLNACDVIVGKVGYSTLAEAYWTGIPFGYIARTIFPESVPLVDYISQQMNGLQISHAQFQHGDWLDLLPDLLAMPRIKREGENGAQQVAEFIAGVLR